MALVHKSVAVARIHVETHDFFVMLNVGGGGSGSRFKQLSADEARYLGQSLVAASDLVTLRQTDWASRHAPSPSASVGTTGGASILSLLKAG
jgi:hypothetical protein